jgi:hypothetical protein
VPMPVHVPPIRHVMSDATTLTPQNRSLDTAIGEPDRPYPAQLIYRHHSQPLGPPERRG